jgi:alanine-synthesizing transaminase
MPKEFKKSNKLDNVLYDIRGPLLKEAAKMEEEGYQIYKLNSGNTAPFGLFAPDELLHDLIVNLPNAQGYTDSKGIFPARKAVMQRCQEIGIPGVETDDIYIGNGVSELIQVSLQSLLNNGDEVLIPMPDYPLWTAATTLSGGKAVHYICDEEQDWVPDIADIKKKVTNKTKEIIKIAHEHDLIVMADEIYDRILYDGAVHHHIATMADDLMFMTFSGLSKVYRAPGFRSGWLIISGKKDHARDFIEGIELLTSMRMCPNAPTQFVIQTSLGGKQSILDLIVPGGRLYEQRVFSHSQIVSIPGLSCVKPKGALYLFPKVDVKKFNVKDDQKMLLDILHQQKVLMTAGSGFNWHKPDHFRLVYLPAVEDLKIITQRLATFFGEYVQE